jgi:hypothetical protein
MTLEIDNDDRDALIIALGYATGKHRKDADPALFHRMLKLADRLGAQFNCIHCHQTLNATGAAYHRCPRKN